MDWPRDDAYLGDGNSALSKVFEFDPAPSTVIRVAKGTNYEAQVWELETHDDWETWANKFVDNANRGLILVLAKRAGCTAAAGLREKPISISNWLSLADEKTTRLADTRRNQVLAPLAEEGREAREPELQRRDIRTLPFSRDTFKLISKKLCVHDSITRVISRSNVPTFSAECVSMRQEPAYVYNCRTSNEWDMDLALSATYLPQRGMTFAIMYGCAFSTELQVMKRLQTIRWEVAHPVLLPGILAELELSRHIPLVESNIIAIERKIYELDFQSRSPNELHSWNVEARNIAKRTAWLDLTYLKNSLVTWTTQLLRMTEHVDELNETVFRPKYKSMLSQALAKTEMDVPRTLLNAACRVNEDVKGNSFQLRTIDRAQNVQVGHDEECGPVVSTEQDGAESGSTDDGTEFDEQEYHSIECLGQENNTESEELYHDQMQTVGDKIKRRVSALRDEYDEKIRDCTTRVEGMAMATQWSHSETNVEIALATNRDSRVMKSISLVTMIFLPGTFFATVFSMTFFDWFGTGGKTRVSSYLWIYVVITVALTAATLAVWYYFVIYRQRIRTMEGEEKIIKC